MALKQWQQIADSEIDRNSPVTEELIGKFHNNQEVMISTPVSIIADTFSGYTVTAGSYTPLFNVPVFIPPAAATADGDVELVLNLLGEMASAGTGDIRARIGGGTWRSNSWVATSPEARDIRFQDADTRGLAGTVALVEFEARTSGPDFEVSNHGSGSRFERVT